MMKKLICLALVLALIPVIAIASINTVNTTGNEEIQNTEASYDISAYVNHMADKVVMDEDNPREADPNYVFDKSDTYEKELVIKYGWDMPEAPSDDYIKFIEEKFKIKLVVITVPFEKILLLEAQDQLPDFFKINMLSHNLEQLNLNDSIYHLDANILKNYPLLNRHFNNHKFLQSYKNITNDNKYVGLPLSTSSVETSKGYDVSVFYRTDWAKNVGMEKPIETVQDQYELMKRFRENDPNGNGAKDTYGYSGKLWSVNYMPWADIYNWEKETKGEFSGKYIPGFISDGMYEAIQYWNRAFKEDLLHENYYGQNGMEELVANTTGIACGNSSEYWLNENLVKFDNEHKSLYSTLPKIDGKDQDANSILGEILPLKKDKGSNPRWPEKPELNINVINSNIDTEKLERILDFYEWTITQQGTNFINYGIKDKDYIVDAQGLVERKDTKKIWEVYPSSMISEIVSFEGSMPTKSKTPKYPVWMQDRRASTQQIKNTNTVPLNVDMNALLTKIDPENLDLFDSTWYENRLNNIISQIDGKSIDTAWEEFKKEVMMKNGRKYIEEVNLKIKSSGK